MKKELLPFNKRKYVNLYRNKFAEKKVATLQKKGEAWKNIGKFNTLFRKQTKIWECKDGTKIRICDMSNFHLINAMKMLIRIAKNLKNECEQSVWSNLSSLSGEMATYYAEQDLNRILKSDHRDFLPSIYFNLDNERSRRNLPEV